MLIPLSKFAAVLIVLGVGGCAWAPQLPESQPAAARVAMPAASGEAAPAHAPEVPSGVPISPATCEATKAGQITGFEEFYAATLKGEAGSKLYISRAPGAAPGRSYGLPGDSVEAIATALDESCEPWLWLKWPESNYRGWLPATFVEIEQ